MLYTQLFFCNVLSVALHIAESQNAFTENSTENTTIIITISVVATIVVITILVVILVGCLCFKRSVKEIKRTEMKRIVNSTTKHMSRVGHLITMDKYYDEIEQAESNILPVIPGEHSKSDETTVAEESEDDNLEVIEIDDETNTDHEENDNGSNNAEKHDKKIDTVIEKSDEIHGNRNVEQIDPSEKYGFLLKRQPSFLKFIVKKHWRQPLLPNIPESRKDIKIDDGKEKNEQIALNKKKRNVVANRKPSKKLKNIRPMKYRHDFFMKPLKTKVTAYKWTKPKPQRNKGNQKKKGKLCSKEKTTLKGSLQRVNRKKAINVNVRKPDDNVDTLVQIDENRIKNEDILYPNSNHVTVNEQHETKQKNEHFVVDDNVNVSKTSERGNDEIDKTLETYTSKSDSVTAIREETAEELSDNTLNVVSTNVNGSDKREEIISI